MAAMESEMDSMYKNQVWTIVDSLVGIITIGNKWAFKWKLGDDGNMGTYQARLVAKSYKEREKIDYDEVFSLVAITKSIRIFLVITTYYDMRSGKWT